MNKISYKLKGQKKSAAIVIRKYVNPVTKVLIGNKNMANGFKTSCENGLRHSGTLCANKRILVMPKKGGRSSLSSAFNWLIVESPRR